MIGQETEGHSYLAEQISRARYNKGPDEYRFPTKRETNAAATGWVTLIVTMEEAQIRDPDFGSSLFSPGESYPSTGFASLYSGLTIHLLIAGWPGDVLSLVGGVDVVRGRADHQPGQAFTHPTLCLAPPCSTCSNAQPRSGVPTPP